MCVLPTGPLTKAVSMYLSSSGSVSLSYCTVRKQHRLPGLLPYCNLEKDTAVKTRRLDNYMMLYTTTGTLSTTAPRPQQK